jgi:hypothetical protein
MRPCQPSPLARNTFRMVRSFGVELAAQRRRSGQTRDRFWVSCQQPFRKKGEGRFARDPLSRFGVRPAAEARNTLRKCEQGRNRHADSEWNQQSVPDCFRPRHPLLAYCLA